MFKKILGTFSSKLMAAVVNFVIVILTTQVLKAGGKGETSMIIANITLIQLLNNFVGGSALVYLIPRMKTWVVLVPAYIWAIISCGLGTSILYYSGQVSDNVVVHVFFLSLIFSFFSIHQMVFMGKQKINWHNILSFTQVLLMLIVLVFFFFVEKIQTVNAFIYAVYAGYGTVFLISWFLTWITMGGFSSKGLRESIRSMLSFSFKVQIASVIAFFNNRLSYYILREYQNTEAVGVYSTGLSIVENSAYMLSKSIAMVQFSKVANEDDDAASIKMTNSLTKISFWAATITYIVLVIIPPTIYSKIFGKDFGEIHQVILGLGPAVLFLSFSTTFLHYFSGKGKYQIVNYATGIGLSVTVTAGFILIDQYGIPGAAITTSLAYIAQGMYLYYHYRKVSPFSIMDLFRLKNELEMLKEWLSDRNTPKA